MDKLKGVTKGGWHAPGDRTIHRDTWKTDLKNRGKQKDPDAEKRATHVSRPLASLTDPAQFAPPPKHQAYYGPDASPRAIAAASPTTTPPARTLPYLSSGGLGSVAPTPARRSTQEEEEEAPKPPPEPYRKDTTGLRTDNLPKPPVRRAGPGSGSSSPAPAPPPRAKPSVPPRQVTRPPPVLPTRTGSGPPPILPPRQTEYPDEYTPAPPPAYHEATSPPQQQQASGMLNQGALNRLGRAGVSVPGFGIGSSPVASPVQSPSVQSNPGQMNELQSRFARMGANTVQTQLADPAQQERFTRAGTNAVQAQLADPAQRERIARAGSNAVQAQMSSPAQQGAQAPWQQQAASRAAAAAPGIASLAAKKAPPPPPAKKPTLSSAGGSTPPPVPTASKPRPP